MSLGPLAPACFVLGGHIHAPWPFWLKVQVGLLRSRRPFYVRCLWFAAWFGRVLFAIWRIGRQRVGRACVPEFVSLCRCAVASLCVCVCVCVCLGVCACAHPGARAHAPSMQYGNLSDTHVFEYPRRVSNPHLPLTSRSPITAFASQLWWGRLSHYTTQAIC